MLEQLHRALQRQTKYFDQLFDLAPDAIVLTEMNSSRIVRVNREFTHLFGYTAEEAVGRSLHTLIAPGELEAEYAANAAAVAAGRTVDMDVVRQRKDGTRLHVHFSSVAIKTDDGKSAAYLVYRDITDRKRIEEALRLSEGRYALAMEAAGDGHTDWNLQTGEHYISPRLLQICGHAPGTTFHDRAEWVRRFPFHPEDRPKWEQAIAAHFAGREPHFKMELRIVVRGEVRWTAFHFLSTRDTAGTPIRWTGSIADITEQKRAEEALRESEGRYERVVAASQAGLFDWDLTTDRYHVSPRLLEMAGIPPGTKIQRREDFQRRVRFHPEDIAKWQQDIKALFASGGSRLSTELRVNLGEETRWYRVDGMCSRDAAGKVVRWTGSGIDVTSRKLAEEALRLSESRYAGALEAAEEGHFDVKYDTNEHFYSDRLYEIVGIAPGTRFANRAEALKQMRFYGSDAEIYLAGIRAAEARNGPERYEFEFRIVHPSGEMRWLRTRGKVTRDAEGNIRRRTGVAVDITEAKLAEQALRESQERFALAVAGSNEGIFDWDLVTDRMYMSQRAQELFGLPLGELWRPRPEWRSLVTVYPGDARQLRQVLSAHIAGEAPYDAEFRVCMLDGSLRWFRQRGIALRDASGKAYRMVGSIGDVTEKHLAEEELRNLERKLRLAQRLEAMGTLAGGIAHDFNNILGAILGYGEMARRDAAKGSRLARDLDSIIVAGERGRALVDRVLAFSRSGVGERVLVHVEKVVREALDLVSAKLPPSVTLHAKLHAGRAAMLGDATQVHQVLMNLATNAVHAMPAGGTLRVSLSVARLEGTRTPTAGIMPAGDCVILEVADSGTGIAPEILDRIFDPFFTTKDVGTGTGLGLSLVHGIVTELGGAIDVASTPGAGSTFTVFLPRSGDALDSPQKEEPELPRGDGQRVLVVDDEEPLVRLATRTLEELGYVATGFTSSAAALSAFRADPQRFDALITDERMPGMSGSRLIREVRGIRERIPVVLMSGYVGGAVSLRARAAGAEEVLQKPLSARDLAASLARVLQPLA